MFCCCPKDNTSYALEEGQAPKGEPQKDLNPSEANIHTGKGPLSNSTQSIPSEASLDKTTVEAARKEKSAITSQPAKTENQSYNHTTEKPDPKIENKIESQKDNPVDISQVEAQITPSSNASPTESATKPDRSDNIDKLASEIEDKSSAQKASLPVEVSQIESQIIPASSVSATESTPKPNTEPGGSFISTVKVGSKSVEQLASTTANLAETHSPLSPFVSQLDNLEKAVSEVESLPSDKAKEKVASLSSQLQTLNCTLISTAKNSPQIMSGDSLQSVVARLEAVTSRLENLSTRQGAGASGNEDDVPEFAETFEKDIVNGSLAKFLKLSGEIGGEVNTQAALVLEAFLAQRDFLRIVARSKAADQATLQQLLLPTSSKITDVQNFRENNRASKQFNHLSAVSEGMPCLGWVTVVKGSLYVQETRESATFYINRVIKDHKESGPKQVEWARAWQTVFKDLQQYTKDHHGSGLAWNPKGGDAKTISAASTSGGPPPPPPPGPPPPPAPNAPPSGGSSAAVDTGALFASINKGADITKGLKKVTDDQKTHKNPQLRLGAAPFKPSAASKPSTSPKPSQRAPAPAAKPPVFELDGKKWIIEHQKSNKNLVIAETELRQTVYAYKCEDSVIQVKGKINSITLDSCKKTAIVFDDLVSALEFVNCQSMQAQVLGKLPTVSIDKTDGCQVYLSDKSLDVEIVSAKSSEMNILVPTPDGDMKEFALPEQYKTKYDGKTMVTTATEST